MLKYKDFVFLYFPSPQLSFVVVVQSLSHVQLFATPWAAAHQLPLSSTISWSLLKFMSIAFSSHLQSFPASGSFQMSQFLMSGAKVLEFQLQHQSFQWRTDFLYDGLFGSPCSPRDSLESSPTPQFKSINSLALSFFYGPTLTSIHDYLKNHSFDY